MNTFLRLSLSALLLLLCALVIWFWQAMPQTPPDVKLANGAELHWTNCWFEWSSDSQRYPQCAHFYPSDADNVAKNQRLRLPVVMLRESNGFLLGNHSHSAKPILYLAGGPGASSYLNDVSIGGYWRIFLEDVAWQGDFVLFDQRGTGLSLPNLICPEMPARVREVLSTVMPLQEELRHVNAAYADCYAYWHEQGVDLAAYNTPRSAQDAAELMQALNQALHTQQWNLYGVSYGTRLGLQIMRDYSPLLHSVILDSVYPPQRHAIAETPFVMQHALDVLFAACQDEPLCNWAYPDVEAHFYALLAQADKQAFDFELLDPETSIPLAIKINASRLLDVIFISLYRWDLIEQIPMLIDQAAAGNTAVLEPLVSAYLEMLLDSSFSDAMHMSVECFDMGKDLDEHRYQQQVAQYPRISRFVENTAAYHPCRFWQNQRADPSFLTAVKSAVPTLLLSGRFDPVTPSQWAQEAAKTLSHSTVLEFLDMGHGLIDSSQCASDIARDFLQNPQQTLDESCIKEAVHPDFVLQESQ